MPLLPSPSLLPAASVLPHGRTHASGGAGLAAKDSIPRPIPCESIALSTREHRQKQDPLSRRGF